MRPRKAILAACTCTLVAGAGWVGLYYDSTAQSMAESADAFLQALSPEQLDKAQMGFDDPHRLDWHFIPKPERKGLQIKEMNPKQRRLAHALLHSGLSEIGFKKSTAIMSLESILHELEKNRKGSLIRDPERYYFTIFGHPGPCGKWGWSVEGHHLSLNFVVSDGKVLAATPAFFGANPATVVNEAGTGIKKGTRALAREETLAFDLLRSLGPEQRQVAIIAAKAPDELRAAGKPTPPSDPPAGLGAAHLTDNQRQTLWELLETYAGNMPTEVGRVWLDEIKQAGPEKVHFAWWGPDKPGVGHYYRVQGPTFVLEFINVQADSIGTPANHIHSVWRSMAGDFGVAS